MQNPVLGDLVNQIYASGLTDTNVKRLLQKGDQKIIQARLDSLKSFNNKRKNNTDNNNNNNNYGDGGDNDGGYGGDGRDDFDGRDGPDIVFPNVPDFNPYNITTPQKKSIPKKYAPRPPKPAPTDQLAPLKVKVRDGLEHDKDFNSSEIEQQKNFNFEKFQDLSDGTSDPYQVSFNRPFTDVKQNDVVELQPEVSLGSDINPLIKKELAEEEKNDSGASSFGFHKFRDKCF